MSSRIALNVMTYKVSLSRVMIAYSSCWRNDTAGPVLALKYRGLDHVTKK